MPDSGSEKVQGKAPRSAGTQGLGRAARSSRDRGAAERKKTQDSWATGMGRGGSFKKMVGTACRKEHGKMQNIRTWTWQVTFLNQSGGGGRTASLQQVKEDATFSISWSMKESGETSWFLRWGGGEGCRLEEGTGKGKAGWLGRGIMMARS